MERELLIEVGCEELPASWLTPLTRQLSERLTARLTEFRLASDVPVETYATPRRLTAVVSRIAERQTDLDEQVSGPPVSAAFGPDGQPTPAAVGFARKHGVEVGELSRIDTPKGRYLAYLRKQRGKTAVDVLPDLLAATLRDLAFPKQMHWDAWLDDGRGELPFGRPIRWLLFLYGGRVVPFTVRRTALAQSPLVQDIRSGAITYGHRFLAISGRPGRAVKVRSFGDYKARLAEHFVILDRGDRHDRIVRELDVHARRLGGRVHTMAVTESRLLEEVTDLVEYPAVVAGTFGHDFLDLPDEVLATTMIHHQHYFPVVDDAGKLMPAFLAVTNIQVDNMRRIALNSERVLTARLRDARFFWEADRRVPLEARLDRLATVVFHKQLGTYRQKAERLDDLAGRIAREALDRPGDEAAARTAGRLAKCDLTAEMVREFTELQGTMGGIYAREQGLPAPVWKAIYLHYLPAAVDPAAPPSAEQLGEAAVTWASVALADKLDTVVGLFGAGERPTGTRDPYGLRRQVHGILKILVDLPELTGVDRAVDLEALVAAATAGYQGMVLEPSSDELAAFLRDRAKYLFTQRGFKPDEVEAVFAAATSGMRPLELRRRLEALQAARSSPDFEALAVLFKRVKNIAREVSPVVLDAYPAQLERELLVEPSERALVDEFDRRAPVIRAALDQRDYRRALAETALFRPGVDRFFTDVFVMVDDERLRRSRLMLMVALRDLVLRMADISQLAAGPA